MAKQTADQRLISALLYFGLLTLVNHSINGEWLPPSGPEGVWVYAALTYWLLVLVSAPFFEAPRDSLVTSIFAVLLVAPIGLVSSSSLDALASLLFVSTLSLSLLTLVAAIISLWLYSRSPRLGRTLRAVQSISYRFCKTFGASAVLLSLAAIFSALVAYSDNQLNFAAVCIFWIFIVLVKPVELLFTVVPDTVFKKSSESRQEFIGRVQRVDDPGLIRFEVEASTKNLIGKVAEVSLAEDFISRLVVLFVQQQSHRQFATGLLVNEQSGSCPLGEVFLAQDIVDGWDLIRTRFELPRGLQACGFVVEDSSTRRLRFERIGDALVATGALVATQVEGTTTYFQVLDAYTDEEYFDGNPRGTQITEAFQLGCRDGHGFKLVQSTATMNFPVFLVPSELTVDEKRSDIEKEVLQVGNVPGTSYPVRASLDKLLEQHCAILGVTGCGKTELAFDLIRTAAKAGKKVLCVDITGDYKHRLSDLSPSLISLTSKEQEDLDEAIAEVEEGDFGGAKEKRVLRKLLQASIDPHFSTEADNFLDDAGAGIAILELDSIANTRASLRATEVFLSAVFDWARTHRGHDGLLIVLEEAHTLVPETNYFGYDRVDTLAVIGRMAQIALQGRKYGIGLCLVSQRTALVSKTLLSQCNTVFAFSMHDETGINYLKNVFSSDHANSLPNLKFLQGLAFGSGINSEQPIMFERPFDQTKLDASKVISSDRRESRENQDTISAKDKPFNDDIPF